jgi:Protein of unknown function (DUF3311)
MSHPTSSTAARREERRDRSFWHWLLVVPLFTVIYPPLYNRTDPELLGVPFFYWYQLLMIPVSMACTVIVYRATRRGPAGRDGANR